jgi:hypothetical protein
VACSCSDRTGIDAAAISWATCCWRTAMADAASWAAATAAATRMDACCLASISPFKRSAPWPSCSNTIQKIIRYVSVNRMHNICAIYTPTQVLSIDFMFRASLMKMPALTASSMSCLKAMLHFALNLASLDKLGSTSLSFEAMGYKSCLLVGPVQVGSRSNDQAISRMSTLAANQAKACDAHPSTSIRLRRALSQTLLLLIRIRLGTSS